MNYMSRLFIECPSDDVMLLNPTLNTKDIELISLWNKYPIYTQQELSNILGVSQYAVSKRINRINSATRYFVKKNKLGYTRREKIYSFRKCLVCGIEFVAESHNRFCSDDCRVDRAIQKQKETSKKTKALVKQNRLLTKDIEFKIDKPKHKRMIPIHLMQYNEVTKMSLKAYVRKYKLDSEIKESLFMKRDGYETRKQVVHISLKGLYKLLEIKHEKYRISNNLSLKESYFRWLEIYNTLNIKD